MKITFEDGSFLEISQSANDANKLSIVMCGRKSPTQMTMSSSEVSKDQIDKIVAFLTEWNNKAV